SLADLGTGCPSRAPVSRICAGRASRNRDPTAAVGCQESVVDTPGRDATGARGLTYVLGGITRTGTFADGDKGTTKGATVDIRRNRGTRTSGQYCYDHDSNRFQEPMMRHIPAFR